MYEILNNEERIGAFCLYPCEQSDPIPSPMQLLSACVFYAITDYRLYVDYSRMMNLIYNILKHINVLNVNIHFCNEQEYFLPRFRKDYQYQFDQFENPANPNYFTWGHPIKNIDMLTLPDTNSDVSEILTPDIVEQRKICLEMAIENDVDVSDNSRDTRFHHCEWSDVSERVSERGKADGKISFGNILNNLKLILDDKILVSHLQKYPKTHVSSKCIVRDDFICKYEALIVKTYSNLTPEVKKTI